MGIEILKEQTCDVCDETPDCAEIETEICGVYWICENCLKKDKCSAGAKHKKGHRGDCFGGTLLKELASNKT